MSPDHRLELHCARMVRTQSEYVNYKLFGTGIELGNNGQILTVQQRSGKKNFHEQVLQKFVDSFNSNLGKQTCVAQHNASERNLSRGKCYRKKTTIVQNFIIPECVLEMTLPGTVPLQACPWLYSLSHLVLWVTPDYFLGTVPDHIVLQTLHRAETKPQPWPC